MAHDCKADSKVFRAEEIKSAKLNLARILQLKAVVALHDAYFQKGHQQIYVRSDQ